ncbi:MAG: hypothetical protein HQL72_10240 [Magnetococcales bacterium]|nr:hypothetical protein [Magnetococcales bacterium]
MMRQRKSVKRNRRARSGRHLFNTLLSPVLSLVGGVSLVTLMAIGLFGSYQARLSVASVNSDIDHPAPGVYYPLPPRKMPETGLSDLITAKTLNPDHLEKKRVDVSAPVPQEEKTPNEAVMHRDIYKTPPLEVPEEAFSAQVQVEAEQIQEEEGPLFSDNLTRYLQYKNRQQAKFTPSMFPKIPLQTLLDDRIEAGRSWLTSSKGGYSIQLIVATSKTIGHFEEYVQRNGLEKFSDDLYLFPLSGKRYLLYMGRFDTVKRAKLSLARLPDSFKKSGAYVIPLQRIRAKVSRQQPDRQLSASR